ncbi:hypothetical protein ACHAW5_000011 [Stephanodiscus triporus]|uniref:Alpha/beta hydrolase fold-3 domain-containing protein n=1 Tax=Stephanodiscus triporus TaxID=2934178 RepID=A0ABD3MWF5_9STRA
MWIHGGGRVIGRSCLPGDVAICCRIVLLFGAPVLSADYRKPPGHPFPAGLDDLREAYRWLSGRVRGGRIGISGMSAGGGLAAELCQRLLDESRGRNDAVGGGGGGGGGGGEERQPAPLPLPACQLLLDPMLDDRTSCGAEKKSESSASFSSSSDDDAPPHILWNHKSNAFAWSLYLGPMYEPGMDSLPEYSSASRRRDLSGLPPAFVHVGDLDLFHDECSAYARRLVEHGVPTELVVTEGGYHGYMLVHIDSGPANEIWERLRAFGGRYLLDENGKNAGVNYKELAYIRE